MEKSPIRAHSMMTIIPLSAWNTAVSDQYQAWTRHFVKRESSQ